MSIRSILVVSFILTFPINHAFSGSEKVKIVVCKVKSVDESCFIVQDGKGRVLDLTGSNNLPNQYDRAFYLQGTTSEEMGTCLQGVKIRDVRWSYTKLSCKMVVKGWEQGNASK